MYHLPEGFVLVLRTCNADMTSHNNFLWPESGPVECHDWSDVPECGHGLHGMLWGEGHHDFLNWSSDAKWLVVEVDQASVIDLGGKVKFPRGNVVCCGDRKTATDFMVRYAPAGTAVIGATVISGDGGHSTSGDMGQSTSGDWGQSTSGYWGRSTSGDWGQSTSGDWGQSTSGYRGCSISGYWGQSTSGDWGQSISGYGGQCRAGLYGVLTIRWYDISKCSYRWATVEVDGEKIKANTFYRCENGEFIEVV